MRPIRRVLLTAAAVSVLLAGGLTWYATRPGLSTVGAVAFDRPLAIPPIAASTTDSAGRRVFDLTAADGVTDFGRGPTRTSGFNGSYLGPTLRVTRSEQVRVNVHNRLAEDTTVHWHGMRLPARADGGPHHPVRPATTAIADWTVDQPAATLWYHPHPDGRSERQIYRGLAGMVVVDDPTTGDAATGAPALPHTYGVDDLPVILQDKRFDPAGQFDTRAPFGSDIGVLGDTLLVNGTVGPYADVRTTLVRLRLLNASVGRAYNLGLSDDRPFTLVGTDGGLLASPHPMTRLLLSVGERAEVVVAMRPGERVVLRSYSPAPDGNLLIRRFEGGADSFDILQLRAADRLADGSALPAQLVELPAPDTGHVVRHRSFDFYRRTINDRRMDHDRIDAVVTRGGTEVWTVRNTHVMPHSFHLHGQQFRVLDVDSAAPPPALSGWKDTLYLPPGRRLLILVTFDGTADPGTPYMFHCHVMRHEDEGMMGQFVVVAPGRHTDAPAGHHDHE